MKRKKKVSFYVFPSYIIRGGIVAKKERANNPTCPNELDWPTWFSFHQM